MVHFHLLHLSNIPIFEQLQLEEALLRADNRNWCIVNEGSSPAIVMGISGCPDLLIDSEKLKLSPIPLIRRFSGGGTVFVDENTCFITFICNAADLGVVSQKDAILQWSEALYRPLFPGGTFRLIENDYVLGNRKFGGNAQYLRRERWLHHSSLLWDYRHENMDYLRMPPRTPHYRAQRSHGDFLCRLADHFPSRQALLESFLTHFQRHFSVAHAPKAIAEDIRLLPHRQATSRVPI